MSGNDVRLPLHPKERREQARRLREKAFELSNPKKPADHESNGEEREFLAQNGFPVSSYSKGLAHNARGEVERGPYKQLLEALRTGREAELARIPLGTPPPFGRRFVGLQSGLSFDLEGPDAQVLTLRPAPRLGGRKNDAEMMELYWMALLRDVSFTAYGQSEEVAAAARELDRFHEQLDMPLARDITPGTLFRGHSRGALAGPYLSQFLLLDFDYGAIEVPQRIRTVLPDQAYLTTFNSWLASQNGAPASEREEPDPELRYIRNLRDLARYVHVDPPYLPYLAAILGLPRLARTPQALVGLQDDGNPYLRRTPNQEGFATFAAPALLALLAEVTTRAAKGMWFQKWFVHRRLRPEEYGGRIDVHRREAAHYPVSQELLSSEAHQRTLRRFGSSLLPQAYPEGAPLHPAYAAGHASSAGACVTILKAFLNERSPWPGRVVVPSDDGKTLRDYTGPDAGALTLGGELDKLAANISLGRSAAGVHWRSDYTEGLRYGERVALAVLREHSLLFNETGHFTVDSFDGRTLRIERGELEVVTEGAAPASPTAAP